MQREWERGHKEGAKHRAGGELKVEAQTRKEFIVAQAIFRKTATQQGGRATEVGMPH